MIFMFQFKKAGRSLERKKYQLLIASCATCPKVVANSEKQIFLLFFFFLFSQKKYVLFVTISTDCCCLTAEVPVLPDDILTLHVESIKC